MASSYTRQGFGAAPALSFLSSALKAGTGPSTRETLQVKQLADYEYKQMQKKEGIELFKAHEDLGLFDDNGNVDFNRVNLLLSPPGAKTYNTGKMIDDPKNPGQQIEQIVPLVSKDNEDKKLFQRLLKYRLSKMPGAGKTLNVASGEEEDFEFNSIVPVKDKNGDDVPGKYNIIGNKYDKSGKFLGIFPVTKLRTSSDSDVVAVYDKSQIISLLEDSRRQAINQGGADTVDNRARYAKLLYANYKDPAATMIPVLEEAIRELPRDSEATKTIMMETVKQAAATGDVDHLRKEVLKMGIDEATFNEGLADAIKKSEAAKAIAANQIDTTAGKASVVKTDAEGDPVTAGTESGLPENEIDEESNKLAEAQVLQVGQARNLFIPQKTFPNYLPKSRGRKLQISKKQPTIVRADPDKDIRVVGPKRQDDKTPLYNDVVISRLSEEFANNIDLKNEFRASLAQDQANKLPRGTTFANKYNLEEELTKAGYDPNLKLSGGAAPITRRNIQMPQAAEAADAVSDQFLGDDPENMAARDVYEKEVLRRQMAGEEPLTESERRSMLGEAGAFGLPMLDRVGGAPETGTGPRRVAAFSANFTDDARGDIEASYQQGIEALKVDPNNPEVLGRVEEFMKGYLESGIPLDKFKAGSPDARRVSANLEANNVRTAKDLSSMSRPAVIEAAAMLWANLPAAQRTADNLAKFQNLAVTGDPTKSGYAVAAEGTARSIDAQNANTNYIKAIDAIRKSTREALKQNELSTGDVKNIESLVNALYPVDMNLSSPLKGDKAEKARKELTKALNINLQALRNTIGFREEQKRAIQIRQSINAALPSYLALLNNELKGAKIFSPTTWFNDWFSGDVPVSRLGGVEGIRIISNPNDPSKVSKIIFVSPQGKEYAGELDYSTVSEEVASRVLDPFIRAVQTLQNSANQAQVQE